MKQNNIYGYASCNHSLVVGANDMVHICLSDADQLSIANWLAACKEELQIYDSLPIKNRISCS